VRVVLVDNAHRLASAGEIVLASAENRNPLKKQEKITNDLLSAIRQATGTQVSTVEEVVHLTTFRPDFDARIASRLKDSGYLTMWEWDMNTSPHWYDPGAFARSIASHEQPTIARHMALGQEEAVRRHQFNLANMLALNSQHPSQTITLFIHLEQKLCELCRLRLSSMRSCCKTSRKS
jgi:hypothetical protein